MEFTKEEIKQGMNEAYQQAGHNAYFGNGFKAGIAFAVAKMEREKIGRLEGVSKLSFDDWMIFNGYVKKQNIWFDKKGWTLTKTEMSEREQAYLGVIIKNSRLDVVSDIEEDEDTEFCPKCNSADIYCEGGEFNEWYCEGCGKCFSEPNVK